jgi:hypothetical protein
MIVKKIPFIVSMVGLNYIPLWTVLHIICAVLNKNEEKQPDDIII